MRRWLWQQAGGMRHGYDTNSDTPTAGESFLALCGAQVTPDEADFGKALDPTCWECDHVMRVRLDFPADEIPPLTDTTPPMPRSACDAPRRPARPAQRG